MGCALLQQQDDGILHPVGYWSKSLSDTQRRYSTTEKECLSVFWAISLLRPYLEGTRFTVRTDHNSLTWILSITPSEGRLARWRLRLSEFDFDIQYRPGIKNVVPGALSRIETTGEDRTSLEEDIPTFLLQEGERQNTLATEEEGWHSLMDMYPEPLDHAVPCLIAVQDIVPENISENEWIMAQSHDFLWQTLLHKSGSDADSPYSLTEQGILVRQSPSTGERQVVVPESLRPRLLHSYHYSAVAGHPGIRRMYETLKQGLYTGQR